MENSGVSVREVARRMTDEGVATDARKVKKWREVLPGRRVAPDAAAALDRVFGTVGVFAQFAYAPEQRGTRAELNDQIERFRREVDDLRRRLDHLEKGNR